MSAHDRIVIQPFYALIELVKMNHKTELEAGTHVIKANKQQLQIFYCNSGDYPEPRLIAQLLFMPADHSYKACILVLDEYITYFQEYPNLLKTALHTAQAMNNTERMAIAHGSSRVLSSFQGQFDSTVTKKQLSILSSKSSGHLLKQWQFNCKLTHTFFSEGSQP